MSDLNQRLPWRVRIKQVIQATRGINIADPNLSKMMAAAYQTASGKSVTPDSAMQLSTVWACIRLIAETAATLPLITYRRGANNARSAATDHPLYALLHDSPSADYTAVEFWEFVLVCLGLWGNAYAEKEFIGKRLVALTPLRCDLMNVERNRDGERIYRYSDPRGQRVLRENEVFHVRGFGTGGLVGLSPISFARQSMGTATAAEEHAGKMFANGFRPSLILKMSQILTAPQRKDLRENIIEPLSGSMNAGGVFLAEAGMDPVPVGMNPDDAQFLETRQFHVEELCRWFRVPPFMIGHTQKSTSWGTGLEQQMIGFLTFSLRPYLKRVEQAISRSLIPPAERGGIFAEFSVEGLLRTDSAARATFYQIMVSNGIYTRNEVRAFENMPPLPGGDALTVQAQNVPIGQQTTTSQNGGLPLDDNQDGAP
ncbi:phage portal protein [Pleomorphomonas koreensis]|uniref:phage portal protein n=1 Tax=Pleomorphomonas koreensis TaxID=257440 RepID=UPI0004119009|nr:phage portal protein [Pleomorphomonas koreensis]